MGNHALFHKELWDWLLKMAGEDDPSGNLMKSAIEEVNNRYKSVESSEIEEETFRDTLPEGYTYNRESLRLISWWMESVTTEDNTKQWVAEYESLETK